MNTTRKGSEWTSHTGEQAYDKIRIFPRRGKEWQIQASLRCYFKSPNQQTLKDNKNICSEHDTGTMLVMLGMWRSKWLYLTKRLKRLKFFDLVTLTLEIYQKEKIPR